VNKTERDKLWAVHGMVNEIRGELPHLARKEDIAAGIAAHETRHHKPTDRRWTRAKTRLAFAIAGLIAAATTALAAWRPWE